MAKDEKVTTPLQNLVVILAGFALVIWIAAGPWSSFIQKGLSPIQPRPAKPTPPPAPSPAPTPDAAAIGGPVPEGSLAVRGRATDAKGEPFAGALVTVRVVERALPHPLEGLDDEARAAVKPLRGAPLSLADRIPLWRQLVWGHTTAELGSATSQRDGRFEVVGPAPARDAVLAVEVRSPSAGTIAALANELHASASDAEGRSLVVGAVVLRPISRVTLFASDTAGHALEGAQVELRLSGIKLLPLTATTGIDGLCEILAPMGDHELSVVKAGFAPATVGVKLGSPVEDLAVQLLPEK